MAKQNMTDFSDVSVPYGYENKRKSELHKFFALVEK